jgi:hypothetical protein
LGNIKERTELFLYGNWFYEGKNDRGHSEQITIGIIKERDEVLINNFIATIYLNGDQFSANAHWYNDYLVFTDRPKYFIRKADEQKMVFGEFIQSGVIGTPLWEHVFTRMKE